MHRDFEALVESLHPQFEDLRAMPPVRFGDLPKSLPKRAIYLFSEGDQDLYVGRTNTLRKRLRNHCRDNAGHNHATFAFRIAREVTGLLKATYTTKGSRAELQRDDSFGPQFFLAKQRLQKMDIRYVEENDPVPQALLEIYVATVLKTPYNDFENH